MSDLDMSSSPSVATWRVRVQVVVEGGHDGSVVRDVFELKPAPLGSDTLGLGLAEARDLLAAVQECVVNQQIIAVLAGQECCLECGVRRRHKGSHVIVMRTLFGTPRLASPRWHNCRCGPQDTATFSPLAGLLAERTTPELVFLEAKFAELKSYALSASVLSEVLPLGRVLHPSEVRRRAQGVAGRLDDELAKEPSPTARPSADDGPRSSALHNPRYRRR